MKLLEVAIQYHKELNPKLWDGTKLKPEVLDKLRQIAEAFIKYLDVPKFKAEDYMLTGSSANFNWTSKSDIDLHIITNAKKLGCEDITEELFDAKKDLFVEKYDITIYGLPVELYVQDIEEEHQSTGEFSVMNNKWIEKPKYSPPDINSREVKQKTNQIKRKIDQAVSKDIGFKAAKALMKRIKAYRHAGLEKEGEFSVENLTFKELRNNGSLAKINQYMKDSRTEELSLT